MKRRYKWDEEKGKLIKFEGPPPDGWSEELFRCSECGKELSITVPRGCRTADSACCGMKANWLLQTPQLLHRKRYQKTGKNDVDSGIPFGNVPGDSDYDNIDTNPLSPKP